MKSISLIQVMPKIVYLPTTVDSTLGILVGLEDFCFFSGGSSVGLDDLFGDGTLVVQDGFGFLGGRGFGNVRFSFSNSIASRT